MLILKIALVACVFIALVSIVWTSLKTGISPMPSSRKARRAMLAATEYSGEGPIVDVGSGWGTLVIAFAKKYPQRQIIGYESSLIPWLVSLALKYIMRINNLSLYREDFLKADLSNASVLLCYLFPKGMRLLKNKLEREGSTVELIVSNTFAVPSSRPEKVIQLNDIYRTPIYVYRRGAGGASG